MSINDANLDRAVAFVDTETTGLDPAFHTPWEVAVIRRGRSGVETEHLFQIRPTWVELQNAEPRALEIGRYHERFRLSEGTEAAEVLEDYVLRPISLADLRVELGMLLRGSSLTGSNPGFDAGMLRRVLLGHTPWHYRPIDVVTLGVGHLKGRGIEVPAGWRSYDVSRAVGVAPPQSGDAHTALGDARWVRDFYDAITRD